MNLNASELSRYSRQISLEQIGVAGQAKLKNTSVLCIGAGGIGSPVLTYLVSCGIGNIGVIDHDKVETSNLHRQILFNEKSCGKSKALMAEQFLLKLNKHANITPYDYEITEDNALAIINCFDLVIDGSDNFTTRYIVNDACFHSGKPLISASVLKFSGQLSVYNYQGGPCLRCLYHTPPPPDLIPNCSEAGVLGVVPGILGSMAANEAVKVVLEIGSVLAGKLLVYDALSASTKKYQIKKNLDCMTCNSSSFSDTPKHYSDTESTDKTQLYSCEMLISAFHTQSVKVELWDVRESWEREIIRIPGSTHTPLQDIDNFSPNNEADTVIYCKSGARSLKAIQRLKAKGFKRVFSLDGGISSWNLNINGKQDCY